MRKRIYIAGPISKGDLTENVNRATAAFVALAKAGFAPFCPHWSCYASPATRVSEHVVSNLGTVHGSEEMQHADWMGVDLAWVAVSDGVLRLPGESTGADLEVSLAIERGLPVFLSVAEVVNAAW